MDGPWGNRVQVATRQEVKDLVARTLHGQSWDECALDIVLANIDTNTGPPMVDASALISPSQSSGTSPMGLAPVPPVLGPLLQYFVGAERKHTARATHGQYYPRSSH